MVGPLYSYLRDFALTVLFIYLEQRSSADIDRNVSVQLSPEIEYFRLFSNKILPIVQKHSMNMAF